LIVICFAAGFIRMRMRRVVMTVLAGVAMTLMACAALMMPERHALPRRNRRHALERHDERNDNSK
jgi:hypothetical protein